MNQLKYLNHYNEETKRQVLKLLQEKRVGAYLLKKYPKPHTLSSDRELFDYVMEIKNRHLKKSSPLSRVSYDNKLHVIENALGSHHFISRVQGAKLKAKNEIKIASLFKSAPEEFLEMTVVHELAHFKEKEHNKAFYKLCTYMQSEYHQVEFDLRLYLTHIEQESKLEAWSKHTPITLSVVQ